jgi:peptidoglycan hydrolase CwlO-like protein
MNTNVKVLSFCIAVAISFAVTQAYFNYLLTNKVNKMNMEVEALNQSLDTLQYKADSLRDEAMMFETELNRYQIALEMLEDEDYAAASEFNKRLSMTE